MTIQHLPTNSVIKIVVPSLTKNKNRIPTKSREKFIKAIIGKSLEINGGYREYKNVQGGYKKTDGTIMYEDVIVIETLGVNPLTERELSCFAKELEQESLYVEDLGNCKAYLYDGEIKDFTDVYDEIIDNGEMIRFYREESSNGDFNKIIQETTDDSGNVVYAGIMPEAEVSQMIADGNEVIENMLNHFAQT